MKRTKHTKHPDDWLVATYRRTTPRNENVDEIRILQDKQGCVRVERDSWTHTDAINTAEELFDFIDTNCGAWLCWDLGWRMKDAVILRQPIVPTQTTNA